MQYLSLFLLGLVESRDMEITETNLGASITSLIPINLIVWSVIELFSYGYYSWCNGPNKFLPIYKSHRHVSKPCKTPESSYEAQNSEHQKDDN